MKLGGSCRFEAYAALMQVFDDINQVPHGVPQPVQTPDD